MTKSIEAQAKEYTKEITSGCCTPKDAKYSEHEYTVCQCELTDGFLAGAKARDAQWLKVVNELREALKKIVKHDKTECPIIGHGTKYEHCSICVADNALDKADEMLKEMGVESGK